MKEQHDLERVYVWDLVVRITHWAIAFGIFVLAATGFYIGHPFGGPAGRAGAHFAMGWVKIIHFYAAMVFTLAVAARVVWMFLGPRRSGWRQFVPASRRRRHDLVQTVKFYSLLRPEPPSTIGHNPLAGLSYLGVFVLYLVMIATGFALYSVSAHDYMHVWQFLLPLFHGAQTARWLHHVTMWILLLFFISHLFFAMMTARNERNGTLDSIFSGFKFMPKGQPPDDADVHDAR